MERGLLASNEENPSRIGDKTIMNFGEGTREFNLLSFYVVVEGDTEWYYIQYLKEFSRLKFNIIKFNGKVKKGWKVKQGVICMCGNDFAFKNFALLEKNMESIPGSRPNIICVFDLDVCLTKPLFKKYKELLSNIVRVYNCELCTSMPSIEYWFLLHYNEMNIDDSYKSSGAVRKKLERIDKSRDLSNSKSNEFWDSDKGKEWVKFLCEDSNLNRAITRAKMKANKEERLEKVSNPKDCNISYSDMYKLFEIK